MSGNRRNGKMQKQVQTSMGEVTVSTPRDRTSTFDPIFWGQSENPVGVLCRYSKVPYLCRQIKSLNPMNTNRSLHKLLQVIFPDVLMEYFDISGWHDDAAKIDVWLDEKHYMELSDYKSGTVISHGFTEEKVIQDFPLRGKPVYLHVRRRR